MPYKIIVLLLLFLTLSCNPYNKEQERVLSFIIKHKKYPENANITKAIHANFSKREIEKLTRHTNRYVRVAFYDALVKHYPDRVFNVLINNLSDRAQIWYTPSYDEIANCSVAHYMITAARKSDILSKQEISVLKDSLIFHRNQHDNPNDKYDNLEGLVSVVIYFSKPQEKYYKTIREAIINAEQPDDAFLKYLSSFKKKEDYGLIKSSLGKLIESDKLLNRQYMTLYLLSTNPQPQYSPLLIRFYNKFFKNRKLRGEECYWPIDLFIEALSKYPTAETLTILNEILQSRALTSECYQEVTVNEQIYYHLKKSNNTYYDGLLKKLEKKVNRKILNDIANEYSQRRELGTGNTYWDE